VATGGKSDKATIRRRTALALSRPTWLIDTVRNDEYIDK
jgi:hypothetical protein